jgi:hypothetical protein
MTGTRKAAGRIGANSLAPSWTCFSFALLSLPKLKTGLRSRKRLESVRFLISKEWMASEPENPTRTKRLGLIFIEGVSTRTPYKSTDRIR